jgi:iron(III) transport system ATP-binding protein
MPALELKNVTKEFSKDKEKVRAVDEVSLTVEQGEMVVFLGPSGCGKTTTLRMVAGFELPSQGTVTIQGADMTRVPVNKRGIGFVFQNYALFPHMSVDQNVAYGLKSRGEKDETIWPKVKKALELVGLGAAGHRFPNQLSGGEQQRVALARVLVMEPTLLLMDEPLSNLDAKLRIHMRTEIRKIQKKLGITCLYVTHDQAEALTMADRVVVMNKGKVEQVGTPKEIYANPSSLFVADFIGQANTIRLPFLRMEKGEAGKGKSAVGGLDCAVAALPSGGEIHARVLRPESIGMDVHLVVRPEKVSVLSPAEFQASQGEGDEAIGIEARVVSAVFVGRHIEYELDLGSLGFISAEQIFDPGVPLFQEGEKVVAAIDPAHAIFLP